MATYYYDSAASGASDGSSKANAYTSINAALAGKAAGDVVLASHTSDETVGTSNTSVTFPSIPTNPVVVRSINFADDSYAPGARIKTTGNSNIALQGSYVIEGVDIAPGFTGATGTVTFTANATTNQACKLKDCTVTIPATANSRPYFAAAGGANVDLDNVTVNSAGGNSMARCQGGTVWRNSTCYAGAAPSFLSYATLSDWGGKATWIACDLSNMAGKTFRGTAATIALEMVFIDCKLPDTFTVFSALSSPQDRVSIVNCSNSSGVLMRQEHDYRGSTTLSMGGIYRAGGATDGVTNFSWKLASTAFATIAFPCYSFDLTFGIAAADVGVEKALTAHLQTDGGVSLAADEAWIEVDYLGDAGSLDTTRASSGPPSTGGGGTAPAADALSTWTTTGLTSPVKHSVSKSFTPAKAGLHRARVALARPATTIYVDPKFVLA